MAVGRHIFFWLAVAVSGTTVSIAMSTPEASERRVQEDIAQVSAHLGPEAADTLVSRANGLYERLWRQTGAEQAVHRKAYIQEQDRMQAERVHGGAVGTGGRAAQNIVASLPAVVYRALFRIELVAVWGWALAVVWAAAMLDGWIERRIKAYSFGAYVPLYYNTALHILIFWIFSNLVLVTIPVTIWVPALFVWAMLGALPFRVMIANFPPTR